VAPGRAAVELVHEIRRHPALRFAGLQAYHGQAQHVRTPAGRRDIIAQAVAGRRLHAQADRGRGRSPCR
jgi:D-serine deaminase-like pyridoxal phosphate-dependent protein